MNIDDNVYFSLNEIERKKFCEDVIDGVWRYSVFPKNHPKAYRMLYFVLERKKEIYIDQEEYEKVIIFQDLLNVLESQHSGQSAQPQFPLPDNNVSMS